MMPFTQQMKCSLYRKTVPTLPFPQSAPRSKSTFRAGADFDLKSLNPTDVVTNYTAIELRVHVIVKCLDGMYAINKNVNDCNQYHCNGKCFSVILISISQKEHPSFAIMFIFTYHVEVVYVINGNSLNNSYFRRGYSFCRGQYF